MSYNYKKAFSNPSMLFNFIKYRFYTIFSDLNPTTVTYNQAKLFFDVREENNELVSSIKPIIKNSKVIFDIGANAGYFSKEIFEAGFSGRVILFEPIPNLMSIAVKTLSSFINEKIFINGALGEETGEIEMFLPNDSNLGWITAVGKKTQNQKSIKANVFDTSYFVNLFEPDFIKIDVEGYEVFVLRPFVKMITNDYNPIFLVELGWGVSNPNWNEFIKVVNSFYLKGYKFYYAKNPNKEIVFQQLENLSSTMDVIIKPSEKSLK